MLGDERSVELPLYETSLKPRSWHGGSGGAVRSTCNTLSVRTPFSFTLSGEKTYVDHDEENVLWIAGGDNIICHSPDEDVGLGGYVKEVRKLLLCTGPVY